MYLRNRLRGVPAPACGRNKGVEGKAAEEGVIKMSGLKTFLGLYYFNILRLVSPGNWPRGVRRGVLCEKCEKKNIITRLSPFKNSNLCFIEVCHISVRQPATRNNV